MLINNCVLSPLSVGSDTDGGYMRKLPLFYMYMKPAILLR